MKRLLGKASIIIFCLIQNLNAQNIVEFETIWEAHGEFYLDNFGRTLRQPGDLNGDGVPDFVLGSYTADQGLPTSDNRGGVKAISGADGAEIFTVFGEFIGDSLFSPDVYPGDVNGDGVPDLVVSASGGSSAEGAADSVGYIKVLSGSNGSLIFKKEGAAGDRLGSDVAVADFNGDGVKDILATGGTVGGSKKGFFRVYNGATGAELYSALEGDAADDKMSFKALIDLTKDGIPDIIGGTVNEGGADAYGYIKAFNGNTGAFLFKFTGTYDNDQIGHNVLSLGDVTGDGVPEVLVGSFLADAGNGNSQSAIGAVQVLNGATGIELYSFRGVCAGDKFGEFVEVLPDVNGDGKPDFLMGAPSADSTGGCTNDDKGIIGVYNGVTGAELFSVRGLHSGDQLGANDRASGYLKGNIKLADVTGDLKLDIIASARNASSFDDTVANVGVVRVINGVSGAVIFDSYGDASGDKLGEEILIVDDISGDGKKDILVTTPDAFSSSGLLRALDVAGTVLFEVVGDEVGDKLGDSSFYGDDLLQAPDFNDDGVPEILVAARGANDPSDGGSNSHGVAKIVSGIDGTVLTNIYGDWGLDGFPLQILLPGDLNGDAVDNIVLCAHTADSADGTVNGAGMCKAIAIEACPADPNKTGPGQCGCGVPDTDTDSDGTADCVDLCPNDSNKLDPLVCGCGVAETDDDLDGTVNCIDQCIADPAKTEPMVCGCGVADSDLDSNGTIDCLEDGSGDGGDVTTLGTLLTTDLNNIKANLKKLKNKKRRKAAVKLIKTARNNIKTYDAALIVFSNSSIDLPTSLTSVVKMSKKSIASSKKNLKLFGKTRKKLNKLIVELLAGL